MRYDVVWTIGDQGAEDRLARIWNYWSQDGAALSPAIAETTSLRTWEKQGIRDAVARLETVLSENPFLVGRAFRGQQHLRVLSQGPLEVGYRIDEAKHRVVILTVRYDDRRN